MQSLFYLVLLGITLMLLVGVGQFLLSALVVLFKDVLPDVGDNRFPSLVYAPSSFESEPSSNPLS